MKKYNHGITDKIAKWLIDQNIATEEEILNCDIYDAGLMIDCYNINHNKKCFIYSKMVKDASGKETFDSVAGYLHEDYDSAKAREKLEQKDIMNHEIDEPFLKKENKKRSNFRIVK